MNHIDRGDGGDDVNSNKARINSSQLSLPEKKLVGTEDNDMSKKKD